MKTRAYAHSSKVVSARALENVDLKIGTLKRTCVYCDLQAKRDECGYVICTRYS